MFNKDYLSDFVNEAYRTIDSKMFTKELIRRYVTELLSYAHVPGDNHFISTGGYTFTMNYWKDEGIELNVYHNLVSYSTFEDGAELVHNSTNGKFIPEESDF